jgi:transposase, IS30 family
MPTHHITKEERIQISALKRAGRTNGEVARQLGRDPSTIGRELRKHATEILPAVFAYRPGTAHRRAKDRRAALNHARQRIAPGSALAVVVEEKLRRYWSPEQIVGRLRRERHGRTTVCHETIYQWVYREHRELVPFLRLSRKRRFRRRYGTKERERRREEGKKRWIEERPKVIEARRRLGDWEGDTVLGAEKHVRLLTHTERKSGYLLVRKLHTSTAEETSRSILELFQKIPKRKRHTITYDNGLEFAAHETIERDSGITIYFARPYHSWERGTNENTNGLLRQFFPKQSLFADITAQRLGRAVTLLNTRPRKRLRYQTPHERFMNRCCSLT